MLFKHSSIELGLYAIAIKILSLHQCDQIHRHHFADSWYPEFVVCQYTMLFGCTTSKSSKRREVLMPSFASFYLA